MEEKSCKKCNYIGEIMLLKNYGYICYNCYCVAEQSEECKVCYGHLIVVKIDEKVIEYRGKDGICNNCWRIYFAVKNNK